MSWVQFYTLKLKEKKKEKNTHIFQGVYIRIPQFISNLFLYPPHTHINIYIIYTVYIL